MPQQARSLRYYKEMVSLILLSLTVVSAALVGCGSQTYEFRLEETSKYFTYLNKVNDSLDPAEMGLMRDYKITIRVPQQFNLLPPPEVKFDEETNEPILVPPNMDDRQPKYMNTILPGLLGAWEANVYLQSSEEEEPAEEEETEIPTAPCYIYLLGNHLKWIEKEKAPSVQPLEYYFEAKDAIASGFRIPPDTDDQPWEWDSKKSPSGIGYVPKKDFESFWFPQEQDDPDIEIHGSYYRVELYYHETGDIQVVLMCVIPEDIASSEKIGERISLMLEQLEVKPVVPKSLKPGGGGGGGGFL